MINGTNISSKHGGMLVDLSTVFINKIIIKVMTECRMWGVKTWAKRTKIIEVGIVTGKQNPRVSATG